MGDGNNNIPDRSQLDATRTGPHERATTGTAVGVIARLVTFLSGGICIHLASLRHGSIRQ